MLEVLCGLTLSEIATWLAMILSMLMLMIVSFYIGYKKGRAYERKTLKCFVHEREAEKEYERWLMKN